MHDQGHSAPSKFDRIRLP